MDHWCAEATDHAILTGVFLRFVIRLGGAGICWIVLAAAVPLTPARADSTSPQLSFDAVNVRQEGVVSFSVLSVGEDPQSNFPSPRFLLGQTDDQTFRLYVDVDSIQQVRFNAFTLTAYVTDSKLAAQKSYKFQITGNPTGSFRDTPVRVSFHVKTASAAPIGSILLPVYNAAKTDLLVPEEQKEPAYVSVSGTTPIQVGITNVPDALTIAVTEVSVREECPSCWQRISFAIDDKHPLVIQPGTNANVALDLVSNSIPALLQGALVIKPDVPHETLAVNLTYHTLPGGADRKQTIPVKIRFGPGLFGLALALLGGIALGLTARYLLTDKLGTANEPPLHAIVSAVVLALIAEVVGVMMTAYGNSKLVLFNLDVDPRQLFPAFILAMLISGGSAVGTWVKGVFGKKS
jgi:hypothetical protein